MQERSWRCFIPQLYPDAVAARRARQRPKKTRALIRARAQLLIEAALLIIGWVVLLSAETNAVTCWASPHCRPAARKIVLVCERGHSLFSLICLQKLFFLRSMLVYRKFICLPISIAPAEERN
jgi:hypothetical protein